MKPVWDQIRQENAQDWDAFGNQYVSQRFGGEAVDQARQQGKTWRDLMMDSNYGERNWQGHFSPEDAHRIADNFLADEIFSEQADTLIKHSGAALTTDKSIPGWIARGLARMAQIMGGEPYSGVTSEGQRVPMTRSGLESTREFLTKTRSEQKVVRAQEEALKVGQKPIRGAAPAPDVTTRTATKLDELASQADTTIPAGESQSPAQVLQTLAEASRTGQGVVLKYSSAPGQPAGSLYEVGEGERRADRRAEIEAARENMPPDALQEMDKRGTVEQFRVSKKSGPMARIWSTDVIAANMHFLAKWANDAIRSGVDPTRLASVVPYELDPAKNSFSENGWRQAIQDNRIFSENQQAGLTGSGQPLNVPEGMPNTYKPEVTGAGAQIPQERADFQNLVFGTQLPKIPRVQKGKTPLNIAGQEVSGATMPGRVEKPEILPGELIRKSFSVEDLQKTGLPATVERPILEVNPARNEMIRISKEAGIPVPETIESWQWLRLDRIRGAKIAPEVTPIRGNTLTLSAGFQPERATEGYKRKRNL
jgi:hypothetical protein